MIRHERPGKAVGTGLFEEQRQPLHKILSVVIVHKDIPATPNSNGEWTHLHLMSVNGKFKDIARADLLAVADRFGIGTAAKKIIKQIEDAVAEWPALAEEAGVDPVEIEQVGKDHEAARLSG